ncbi:WD40 repeat domain-containing protein [Streptomyces mirabilis]|uniref:WD40 repeat domain-containing protein n=1 Tax=Streptomyces mirabilis TaxID=68239 RepID=UPI002E2C754E|nr:WD40 repeat domain-containing protein [Streptomyces mirabilis]
MTTHGTAADPPQDAAHQPTPSGAGDCAVELFPVNFTAYRHHPDLDTDQHVQAIGALLAPFGVRLNEWGNQPEKRDRQAVEDRLADWSTPPAPPRSANTLLYWVGHGSATHRDAVLAHHRTPTPMASGVSPQDIAHALGSRQVHPDAEDSWAIVVLDACRSRRFAQLVHAELLTGHADAQRYLLLSTAAEGAAELGSFTRALERALTVTFRGQPAIGLVKLGAQLAHELGGYRGDTVDDDRDQLVRVAPDIATAVSAPLDQLAELQAVIDQLPTDEQRHFIPKASGAELGELAWYFHGRILQRDRILHWLTTATHGALVVTGSAGAGKSALLGHVLLHTRTQLRDILIRHGHLQPLPDGTPCPDDPFDLVTHLSGLTLTRTVQLIADAAELPDIAQEAADGQPPAALAGRLVEELRRRGTPLTLLFDALDEAVQPLALADLLLHPLAVLPTVRVVIGTRRSTHEGPDQPTPADTDILDTLRPRASATPTNRPEAHVEFVEVAQDREAFAGYIRAKLSTARRQGTLNIDDEHITNAVRLLASHHQPGAEPQQFLYVRLAAHELLRDPDLITDPTPVLGQTHRQLFTRALDRLHRTNSAYTPLLHTLGLAQGRGIPDQAGIWAHAADALAPTPTDTGSAIPDLLRDAAPYLALDQEHDQSVYRLAHRTFTEHFTAAPDTAESHAALCSALIQHTLATPSIQAANPTPPLDISPYTRHHLAAHARLGATAGAFQALADHPDVLDTLDLTSITTAVLNHGLPSQGLPPAIAGTVLLQHHARRSPTDAERRGSAAEWRRWLRRLAITYIQGSAPPTEMHDIGPTGLPATVLTANVERRQPHLQLNGPDRWVKAVVVFSAADGTPRLATGGMDGTVRVWDPATGAQVGEPLYGHSGGVNAVAVFPAADGTPRLATAGDDGTVRVWDPVAGIQVGLATGAFPGGVNAVAVFSASDGSPRLATAGDDGMVRVWDPVAGIQVGLATGAFPGGVNAVAVFSASDGSPRLATAGDDGMVRVWDPVAGIQVGEPLTGHNHGVNAVALFSASDGSPRLATAGDDGMVRVWDPVAGIQVGQPLTGHRSRVSAIAVFSVPDGTPRLATAGNDQTMRVWDPAAGLQVGEPLTGPDGGVKTVAVFSAADGTPRLATGGVDGTVRIWIPVAGGQLNLATSGDELSVRVWEPVPRARFRDSLAGQNREVNAVVVFSAADGSPLLATGGSDGTVRVWDPVAGIQVGEILTGHNRYVSAMAAFSDADGAPRLATSGLDGTVRVWDPVAGIQVGEPLTGHLDWVNAVAVFPAPDGTPRLATASDDGTVRVWDPVAGIQVGEPLTGHKRWVKAVVVFSAADGSPLLATGGSDGTVRVWDPVAGLQVGEPLTGHKRWVKAMAAFSAADGSPRLATGGGDGTVRVWDPVAGLQVGEILTGHDHGVNAVAAFAAADGTPRLAAGGNSEVVQIWEPLTRPERGLPLAIPILALAAGDGLLAVGTSAGHLVLKAT